MTQVFSRGKTGIGANPINVRGVRGPQHPLIRAIHQLDHPIQDRRRNGEVVEAWIRRVTAASPAYQRYQTEREGEK